MNRQAPAAATLFALLLVLIAGEARAQIGRVAGTVADEDGSPIKGATITAENRELTPPTFTSTSDDKGRFSILGLRRGSWVFTIQAPGFEKATARLDVLTARPNPPLTVRLLKALAPTPAGPLSGIDARELQRRLDAAAALAVSGDHSGALSAYREVLARVPALTSLLLEIGALHERLNDTSGALAAYKRLLELEPAHAGARAAVERLGGAR
jgi:hypothetical protein